MLEIGSIIDGKYKVLNVIGKGGMSIVYLVMNEKANKQWAIKEIIKRFRFRWSRYRLGNTNICSSNIIYFTNERNIYKSKS